MAEDKFAELKNALVSAMEVMMSEKLGEMHVTQGAILAQQLQIITLLQNQSSGGRPAKVGGSGSKTGKKGKGRKSGVPANGKSLLAMLVVENEGGDPPALTAVFDAARATLGITSWDDYAPVATLTPNEKKWKNIGYEVWKISNDEMKDKVRAHRKNLAQQEEAERSSADLVSDDGGEGTSGAGTDAA